MTNGISDFGSALYTATITGSTVGAYSQVAEVKKLKLPDIKGVSVDLSSHQSTGGYNESRPSGKKEIGEMEFSAVFVSASATNSWITDLNQGTTKAYKIIYGSSASFVFSGYPTEFSIEEADSDSPNGGVYNLKVQPTGGYTLS